MKTFLLNLYFHFFATLARVYLKRQKPYVVGVTGSIWKTSCRMIVSEILTSNLKDKVVYTSSKNFNGELGMSLSILGISDYEPQLFSVLKTFGKAIQMSLFWDKLYDIIVLEYGIDHIWEMDFLLSIVKPDVGIVTKIDKVHSSQFASKDITAQEKYKLLQATQSLSFLNFDDEYAKKFEHKISSHKKYYTTNHHLTNEEINIKGLSYTLKYEWEIKSTFDLYLDNQKTIQVTSNLVGEENIWYIWVWLFILDSLFKTYYKKTYFTKGADKITLNFTLQYSRFSMFEVIWDSIAIDSSYNAAPESMKKVIDNFLLTSKHIFPDYEIILCLWEMRELGDYTKEEHEKLVEYTRNITDTICIVWNSMKEYFLPKNGNAKYFKNSKLLGAYLKDFLQNTEKKYLILFKGSQNTIFMEEALKQILKHKSDETKICRQEKFWIEKKNNFFDK